MVFFIYCTKFLGVGFRIGVGFGYTFFWGSKAASSSKKTVKEFGDWHDGLPLNFWKRKELTKTEADFSTLSKTLTHAEADFSRLQLTGPCRLQYCTVYTSLALLEF